MSDAIGRGVLQVEADASGVSAGMAKAGDAVDKFERRVSSSARSTAQAMQRAEADLTRWHEGMQRATQAMTAFAVAGGAAVTAAILSEVHAMDTLSRRAEGLGVSASRLSGLEAVFRHDGLAAADLDRALQRLSKTAAAAAGGNKAAATLFNTLGVSVRDASGEIKTADQLLFEIADKFRSYQAGAAENALATKVFGDEMGTRLLPALNEGSEGMQRAMDDARRFGLVVGDETAAQARALTRDIRDLTTILGGLKTEIASSVLPTLADLARGLNDGVRAAGGFGAFLTSGLSTSDFAHAADKLAEIEAKLAKLREERAAVERSLANRTPVLRSLPLIGTSGDLATLDWQIQQAEAQRRMLESALSRQQAAANVAAVVPAPLVPPASKKSAPRSSGRIDTRQQADTRRALSFRRTGLAARYVGGRPPQWRFFFARSLCSAMGGPAGGSREPASPTSGPPTRRFRPPTNDRGASHATVHAPGRRFDSMGGSTSRRCV